MSVTSRYLICIFWYFFLICTFIIIVVLNNNFFQIFSWCHLAVTHLDLKILSTSSRYFNDIFISAWRYIFPKFANFLWVPSLYNPVYCSFSRTCDKITTHQTYLSSQRKYYIVITQRKELSESFPYVLKQKSLSKSISGVVNFMETVKFRRTTHLEFYGNIWWYNFPHIWRSMFQNFIHILCGLAEISAPAGAMGRGTHFLKELSILSC